MAVAGIELVVFSAEGLGAESENSVAGAVENREGEHVGCCD